MPVPTPPSPHADILATAVLPWTARYELDERAFRRQVQSISRELTPHIYVFGTAGEGYAVNERQFNRIVSVFWDSAHECGVFPMVGVISLSLSTIIDRIERSCALGFRTFQLSLPGWGALTDRELDTFFAETCGRFRHCQFHHYNLSRTKRLLTSVEYRRLAAAHPNFVAVKSSAAEPAVVADLLKVTPRLRMFMTERGYVIARRTHDVGLLISLAAINPARAKSFTAGNDEQRARDAAELEAVRKALLPHSPAGYHMDGAFDKMLFRLTDPAFPLRLLPPYAGATEKDFARFKAAIPRSWRRA